MGSVAGFSAYAYALKHLPVATVSLYAYVNPIIAVVLGTLVLGEPLNPRLALAGVVVLVGMGLARDSPLRVAQRERHRALDDDLAVHARHAFQAAHSAAHAEHDGLDDDRVARPHRLAVTDALDSGKER